MAIADRINEMYTHVGDVYDTITNVDLPTNKNIQNIPQTIKDSYLEIMNNGIDTIWNNWEKVTGEGTSLTLNNTYQAPMRNNLKGNTSQTQYSGKNLLPPTIATETKNGITLTNNGDGSYTLTGTYSTSTIFDMALPATLNGTYSFSGNNPTAGKNIQFRILTSSGSPLSTYLNKVNKTYENQTIENGTKQSIRIVGSFTSGFTFKPQLESGSTATSYEPYVGGVATPNPTNPADVNVVSGDNEVHIDTKNKISFKNLTNSTLKGIDVTYNNSEVKLNGTTTSSGNIIPVGTNLQLSIPAGTYTFSLRVKSGSNSGIGGGNDMAIYLTKSSGSSTSVWLASMTISQINNGSGVKSVTFTTETPVNLYIYTYANNSGITFENYTLEAQIEEGNSMTSYIPYDGDTYNIDLPMGINLYDFMNNTYNNEGNLTITKLSNEFIFTNNSSNLGRIIFSDANVSSSKNYVISFEINNPDGKLARLGWSGSSKTVETTATSGKITGVLTGITTSAFSIYIDGNSTITITNLMYYEGTNTSKTYEPYGITPIELCKIGNYQDYFAKSDGRNLFDKSLFGAFTTTIQYVDITLRPNTTYTMSSNIPITSGVGTNLFFMKYGETASTSTNGVRPDTPVTLTTDSTGIVKVGYRTGTGVSANPKTDYWYMINEGSTALPYQPYGVGKWYLHKEIGKVVLNGSESWGLHGSIASWFYADNLISGDTLSDSSNSMLSNYFKQEKYSDVVTLTNGQFAYTPSGNKRLVLKDTDYTTVADFKTWLSTHNTNVYYVLATPTNTEITDTTLINQLEQFYQAQSKNNQTNISQINNDLGFIISASALKKDGVTPNNNVSLLMSVEESPNTNVEEETPIEESIEEETPIEESIEEETPIEESIEEETDEEPVEEEEEQ